MSSERREWLARFEKGPSKDVIQYLEIPSLARERAQYYDPLIKLNLAHVIMLAKQGILKTDEAAQILTVLLDLDRDGLKLIEPLDQTLDLYFNVENYLVKRVGESIGGKMHTGRSRNDLHTAEVRLWARARLVEVMSNVLGMQTALIKLARENVEAVMPGYTHSQQAQPITLAHWAVSYVDALERRLFCLKHAYELTNLNPLGAAALAGTGFPIDRTITTELLGFQGMIENSLDAVSTRDYIVDSISALAMIACDLSRMCEELMIWSTFEFKFVELAEEYCESSSIMPQKKNPQALEHCRGKAGVVFGSLMSSLTVLKSLASGYNSDYPESDVALRQAFDETTIMLKLLAGIVSTMKSLPDSMREKLKLGFSTATELADTIVREGHLSFRTAHKIVGTLTKISTQRNIPPDAITGKLVDEAAIIITGKPLNLAEAQIKSALTPDDNVAKRKTRGGPAPEEVKRMILDRNERISSHQKEVDLLKDSQSQTANRLRDAALNIIKSASR